MAVMTGVAAAVTVVTAALAPGRRALAGAGVAGGPAVVISGVAAVTITGVAAVTITGVAAVVVVSGGRSVAPGG
jgi:hypothetical protein